MQTECETAAMQSPLALQRGRVREGVPSIMSKAKRTPSAKTAARRLRKQQTDAEAKLWSCLRRRRLKGLHFRRQSPIGPYVADFVCTDSRVIVELDGGQHTWRTDQDARRTEWLESQGYRVIRFWNNEVTNNIEGVLETIARIAVKTPPPHPSPSEEGEGENTQRSQKDLSIG